MCIQFIQSKIKKMTTLEMRQYATSLGHKIIGLTNEQLESLVNVPEEGEWIRVRMKKDTEPIDAIYLGFFQCKKTQQFYARLTFNPATKKYFTKQLKKIIRYETTTETTES